MPLELPASGSSCTAPDKLPRQGDSCRMLWSADGTPTDSLAFLFGAAPSKGFCPGEGNGRVLRWTTPLETRHAGAIPIYPGGATLASLRMSPSQ